MIPVPTGVRIWLATGHTDMRRGYSSLSLQVQEVLRTAAGRTVGALWDGIQSVLDAFTPQECSTYLKHAGYAST